MTELKIDSVKTGSLTIVNAEGKNVATISPANGGAGLWITGPGGDIIAIYSIKGQTAIGIYDKQSVSGNGMPIALTIWDGIPTVQFRTKSGEIKQVALESLVAA